MRPPSPGRGIAIAAGRRRARSRDRGRVEPGQIQALARGEALEQRPDALRLRRAVFPRSRARGWSRCDSARAAPRPALRDPGRRRRGRGGPSQVGRARRGRLGGEVTGVAPARRAARNRSARAGLRSPISNPSSSANGSGGSSVLVGRGPRRAIALAVKLAGKALFEREQRPAGPHTRRVDDGQLLLLRSMGGGACCLRRGAGLCRQTHLRISL